MIKDDAVRFLEEINNSKEYVRFGKCFKTKEKKYFYDTGTGKVCECEQEEYELLNTLIDNNNYNKVVEMLEEPQYLEAIENIFQLYKNENMLQDRGISLFEFPRKEDIDNCIENGIRQVILEVTEQCNLRCKYCIYNDAYEKNRNFSAKNMTWEIAKKMLDYTALHSQEKLSLGFYGGEPLLRFPFIKDCIDYAQKIMSNKKITYSMTTNATLVTDEIATYLAELEDCSIMVSLDGPMDIHNKFRIKTDGTGSFEATISGLKKLMVAFGDRAEQCISINSVVCPPYNMEKMDRMKNFFDSLEWFPKKTVRRISYVSPDSLDDKDLGDYKKIKEMTSAEFFCQSNEAIDPIGEWCFEQIRHTELTKEKSETLGDFIQNEYLRIQKRWLTKEPLDFMPMHGCCMPGMRRLYCTVDGNFKICERIGNSPYIGNVNDGISKHDMYEKYIKEYGEKVAPLCAKCWAKNICSLCYNTCFDETGVDIKRKEASCISERNACQRRLEHYHETLENQPDSLEFLNDIKME